MAREITVRLNADISNFIRSMEQAKQASSDTGRALGKAGDDTREMGRKTSNAARNIEADTRKMGETLTAFGTGVVGALAAATTAAVSWESSWIDVARRTEGTESQLEGLEEGLRGIARELPTTHSEVAAVAAAAAQLGVGVEDAEEFTETMIAMGVSTNLSAEQAATSMQRFANIMGTPIDEMSNLGSSVVDLGNNSATTEAEVMSMAQRLAGAGAQAGLSEGDVTGLAAAMSSMGIEAQAGGSALTRTMTTIGLEVDRNSPKLETFAEVAGMSADDFATAWENDAAGALISFVEGLARVEQSGGSVNTTLDELGITAIREADVIRRLASNTDMLSESVERGNSAYQENTAMMEEAEGVYASTTSQIKATWAEVQDSLIDIGSHFLPIVDTLLTGISSLASGFQALPDPLKAIVSIGGGAVGVLSLLAGSAFLLAPQIASTVTAFRNFRTPLANAAQGIGRTSRSMGRMLPNMRNMAIAGAAATAAIAGFAILKSHQQDAEDFATSVSKMGQELLTAAEGGEAFAAVEWDRGWLGGDSVNHLGDAMERVSEGSWTDGLADFAQGIGLGDSQVHDLRANLENLDTAIADAFAQENFEEASAGFQQVADEAKALGLSSEEVTELFPNMTDAIRDAATAAEVSVTDQQLLGIATSEAALEALAAEESWRAINEAFRTGSYEAEEAEESILSLSDIASGAGAGVGTLKEALEGQAEAAEEASSQLDDVIQAYSLLGLIQLDAHMSAGYLEESFRNLNAQIEENGPSLDVSTEAGLKNSEAFSDAAQSGLDHAEAMLRDGAAADEVQGSLQGTYDNLLDVASGYFDSSEEAENFAAMMMQIPEEYRTDVEAYFSDFASDGVEAVGEDVDNIPSRKDIEIGAEVDEAQQVIAALQNQDIQAVAELLGDDSKAQGVILDITTGEYIADVDVDGNTTKADEVMAAFMNKDWATVAELTAEDEKARQVIQTFLNEEYPVSSEIDLDDTEARFKVGELTDDPWGVRLEANAIIKSAVADLNQASRDRISDVFADADVIDAEGNLTDTARSRIADILADSETGLAESDLTATARQRISDVIADPSTWNAEGELTNTARQRISGIIADPSTWGAESDLNQTARTRWAEVNGRALTWSAESDLNNTARTRYASIIASVVSSGPTLRQTMDSTGLLNQSRGGLIPSLASGGQLPYTGLGTDMILGVNSFGRPVANVDDGEFVTRESQTRKHLPLLQATNRGDIATMRRYLQSLAGGGVAGAGPRSVVEHAAPRPLPVAPSSPQGISSPGPSRMTGTLYAESGALLGEVRMAMKDEDVIRTARQSFQEQGQQDRLKG